MTTQQAMAIRLRNVSTFLSSIAALVLFLPALASAQAPPSQKANNNPIPTSALTVSVPFPNPETTNDVNVVVIGWSDSVSVVKSVSDTAGNKYVLAAGTNSANSASQAIYYGVVTKGGGSANSVNVTFDQNAAFPDVRIFEYTGVNTTGSPLEVATGATGGTKNTASVADSGGAATASAVDILVGAGTTTGSFSNTPPAGSSFTVELLTPGFDIDTDANTSAAGTYHATANVTGPWVMQMIALRGAGQAAPAPSAPTVTGISPNSGGDAGGDVITITGIDFRAGAAVTFGGVSGINCVVASAMSVSCATPPSPTNQTVSVVVTNPDGQSATSPTDFSYSFSGPTITNITAAGGGALTTNGGPVTLTGTNFVGPALITVDGVPATNITVSSSTKISATFPAHAAGSANVGEQNSDGGVASGTTTYVAGTGTVNFVQSASANPQSAQPTVTVAYANPQTAGNLNVVVIGWSDITHSVSAVTDSNGNKYVAALNATKAAAVSQVIYYAANIKTGTNTVTVTFNGAASFADVRVMEYSGLDTSTPLDSVAAKAGSGTPATSGPITTHSPVDVVIGSGTVTSAMTGPGANLDNFTLVHITKPNGDLDEQLITSSAGTYSAQADVTSGGNWVMEAVAFKAPAGTSAPNFTVTASPGSASVSPGSSATFTLSVSAQNGFSGPVSLSCSAPANTGIACSLSPSSVTPGGAPATATLTATTTGATAALVTPRHNTLSPLYAVWLPLPAIAIAGMGLGSQRRKLVLGIVCLALMAFCFMLTGCGGGGGSSSGGGGGTPAGTYNITVTATSGNLSHSTQTTLTVQ